MTTQDPTTQSDANAANANPKNFRRTYLGVALIGTLILGSSLAFAGGPRGWFGHGRGHGGGGFDPEMAQERAQRAADWITRYVDATPEQEAQIDAILGDAIDQLAANPPDPRASRDDVIAVLAAETVDRAALEDLRLEHLNRAEEFSRILTNTVANIAEVLTPEQRAELVEAAEHFHGRRGHHGRRGQRRHDSPAPEGDRS